MLFVTYKKKTLVKTYLIPKIYGVIRRQTDLFSFTSMPLVSILIVEKGSCSNVISLYSLPFSGKNVEKYFRAISKTSKAHLKEMLKLSNMIVMRMK